MKRVSKHIKFQAKYRTIDTLYRVRIKKYKKKKQGARWAKDNEVRKFMNSENKGILLDGHLGKLSEKESFKHLAVFGCSGAGKSTVYALTNLFSLAKNNCSIVVNDPKGELLEATGGYFQINGFDLKVLNPEDKDNSDRFNVFLNCKREAEIEKNAQVLVTASSNGENKDEIWNKGATKLMSCLLKLLKNAGLEDKAYNTLGNLYYCFQNFGDMGKGLHLFALKYAFPENDFYVYQLWTEWSEENKLDGKDSLEQIQDFLEKLNKVEPQNMRLWNEWLGAVQGNREGVNSFVLNAITALRSLSNEDIDTITASSTFNIEDIRHKKTIIFLVTPPADQKYYHFLVSLFFVSVFNMASSEKPTKDTLPLYCIYDEFGLSSIPNMEDFANTVRSYKVSISILMQNINQLTMRYGLTEGKVILGAFSTKANFTGSDDETRKYFEELCGKVIEYEPMYDKETEKIYKRRHEYNLINSGELRTLPEDEAVIIHFNRHPIIKKIYPYYEVPNYHENANLPFELKFEKQENSLIYVPLK